MINLNVVAVENGFVVYEGGDYGRQGKSWAFESATSLAAFIKKWGVEDEKARDK